MKNYSIIIKARGLGQFSRHIATTEYQLEASGPAAASNEAKRRFNARGFDMEILTAIAVQIS